MVIAKQSEVLIKKRISVTCLSSIETKAKFWKTRFAVVENNYNVLRAPFSEEHFQKNKIQNFTVIFECSSKDQPTNVSFPTLIEKNPFLLIC